MKLQHEIDAPVRTSRGVRLPAAVQNREKAKAKTIVRIETLRRLAEDRLRHFETLR